MGDATILVVDDESRMRKLIKDFLIQKNYNILEAEDGERALKVYEENKEKIDLILLDVMMPKLDGWSVLRNIRQENKKLPIVMLTARAEEQDELFGFELGVDEYISKPFSPKILVARVEALLKRTKGNAKEVKEKFLQEIENASKEQISMGLYSKNVNKFYLLKLRENVNSILDEYELPEVLKTLDLIVLHKVIISKELGYTQEEQMAQDGILYIKQEQEAFDMIDMGKAEASFIMAYPKIQDIKRISEAGERMPQKSTYFYPKLLSGIVINSHE